MNWITFIGFIAATCTTLAFLPQAIKTIKTKHTKDLSFVTYFVLTIGIFIWLVYGLIINDFPLIIANAITFLFAFIILMLKIKYK